MQTYVVYIGLLVVLFLFSKMVEITQKTKYVWLIVFCLSIVAGIRKYTVGLDTDEYFSAFSHIIDGNIHLAYGMEQSFRYICYFLSFVLKQPQWFLIMFAIVTNGLIVLRIWELKKYISFSWAIVGYYIMFFMMSLNLTRQFVAVAIVFWGSRYVVKGKYIIFMIIVGLASLFHQSALIGLAIIFFEFFAWRELPKNKKRFLVFCLALLPGIILYLFRNMEKYMDYFNSVNINIGFMIICKLAIIVVSCVALRIETISVEDEVKDNVGYLRKLTLISYLIGLLLTALGYIWRFVDRIGLFFYLFESIYIGIIFRQRNIRRNFLIKLAMFCVLMYQLYGNLKGNGQGQHPYLFYWQ